jgi:ABC-type nickel/cobalt efflux system permease component RcnA
MFKFRLIVTLMGIVAVIIVGMAIYVFTNFSTIDFKQSIILIIFGAAGMIIVVGILAIVYKSSKLPR